MRVPALDQVQAYLEARYGDAPDDLRLLSQTGRLGQYAFVQGGELRGLTIAYPEPLFGRPGWLTRLRVMRMVGDAGLAPPLLDVDEQPEALPLNVLAWVTAWPDGEPLSEASFLAEPLKLATLLQRLHSLGATSGFEALNLPEVSHPQLKALDPLTPATALAWYLPQYGEALPKVVPVAQLLARLWMALEAEWQAATFAINQNVLVHGALRLDQVWVASDGRWLLTGFEGAVLDDPVLDFIWALDALDDGGKRAFLDAYGLPDFAHDEWLAHARLRLIYRRLEAASEYAYTIAALLTGEPLAQFPPLAVGPDDLDNCYAQYHSQVTAAANALGLAGPAEERWDP